MISIQFRNRTEPQPTEFTQPVSNQDLRKYKLVEGQVRHRRPQPLILFLKSFEFLQLVGSHTAILLAPAVIGLFGNTNRPDRIDPLQTLTDKHFNLPQLRDNFFRLASLHSHFDPPFF